MSYTGDRIEGQSHTGGRLTEKERLSAYMTGPFKKGRQKPPIWEIKNWREAEGVIAEPNETNSALAMRDYSVPCHTSEHHITVVEGYWLWWCSAHHQPLAWCDKARAVEQARQEVAREIFNKIEKALLTDEEIAQAAQMEWNASHLRVAQAQQQKILGLLNNTTRTSTKGCLVR